MPASWRSRRVWGWHRLDEEWAARVVSAAGVRPGELVFHIGAGEGALVGADLVLQRAVVRKYASGSTRRFSLTIGLALPRRAFVPPPHVDSAVLVVRRRK